MSHALLSASGAARWLACPPSAKLEQKYPDSTSEYAREGSLAHEFCELKVSHKFLGKSVSVAIPELKKHELYQPEMDGYTDQYLDFVSKVYMSFDSDPFLAVEKHLDFSQWVPGGFGTGDCIIIGGSDLHIIDFKYGKGVAVSPENNPQMMLYALGAYEAYGLLYPVKTISMSIVQPRIDNIETSEIDIADLLSWAENTVRPTAQLAIEGKGNFAAGDHCRFCRAKGACRQRAAFNMDIEPATKKDPAILAPDEIGEYLTRSADVVAWANDLKEYALSQCLDGVKIPGWKAVEGRSLRAWTDEDKAFEYAHKELKIPNTKLYVKKPVTVAALEKAIGKDKFKDMESYVVKPAGKPALAAEKDKRPAITNKPTAKEAFAESEEK